MYHIHIFMILACKVFYHIQFKTFFRDLCINKSVLLPECYSPANTYFFRD